MSPPALGLMGARTEETRAVVQDKVPRESKRDLETHSGDRW